MNVLSEAMRETARLERTIERWEKINDENHAAILALIGDEAFTADCPSWRRVIEALEKKITTAESAAARRLEVLRTIGSILSENGCECACDCDSDGHNDDCEVCVGCRISDVIRRELETP